MLDWAVIEPLTLTFNVEYAKDDYGHSDSRPYGLRDGTASVFSLDAAYTHQREVAAQRVVHARQRPRPPSSASATPTAARPRR